MVDAQEYRGNPNAANPIIAYVALGGFKPFGPFAKVRFHDWFAPIIQNVIGEVQFDPLTLRCIHDLFEAMIFCRAFSQSPWIMSLPIGGSSTMPKPKAICCIVYSMPRSIISSVSTIFMDFHVFTSSLSQIRSSLFSRMRRVTIHSSGAES